MITGTVGFLGPKGSFTETAAKALLPDKKRIPFRSIPDSIDAVKGNQVECTVVPLENAIEGSVNITLDYLIHHQRLEIAAEIIAPIQQHLLVRPENKTSWHIVNKIFSHPHAIAQCHQFLRKNFPDTEIKHMNSTAAAAKYISEQSDKNFAAIANTIASKEYGLEIVQTEINDYENNSTRFIVLVKEVSGENLFIRSKEKKFKTTFMVTLPLDYSGALHQVLSAFSWRKINLSKIESRPRKTGLGNYYFIIDADIKIDKILIPGVCEELKALGFGVEILGSYPCFVWSGSYH